MRFIKPKYYLHFFFLLILLSCQQEDHEILPLWPGPPPGSEHLDLQETSRNMGINFLVNDRAISQIQQPTIEIFTPEKPDGMAVLICPGGGYWLLAYDREGTDVARSLNKMGITAFVLKYRLPAEGHRHQSNVPLQDTQRAMRIIRANATKWGIDPDQIGVAGFSAGGHLASLLGTGYDWPVYPWQDGLELISARPDFMVLLYPVISMDDGITHQGSKNALLGTSAGTELSDHYSAEKQVTSYTPPAFLVHAEDDPIVMAENSRLFYRVLIDSGITAELHLYPKGGHGFGVNRRTMPGKEWPGLFKEWYVSGGAHRQK